MVDMWRSRDKPTPLDFESIVESGLVVEGPSIYLGAGEWSREQGVPVKRQR